MGSALSVCFISTYPPQQCGIGTYTKALKTALEAEGAKVTVITEVAPGLREPPKLNSIYPMWARGAAYDGPFGLGKVARSILHADQPPDVVHIQHEFGLFPQCAELHRFVDELTEADVKVVMTLHTVPLHDWQWPTFLDGFRGARFIVHTLAGAAALSRRGWPGHGIPHGVELHETPPEFGPLLALNPGFIVPGKGTLEIMNGWAKRTARCGDQLVISGLCRDDGFRLQIEQRRNDLEDVTLNFGFKENLGFANCNAVILGAGKETPLSASGQLHTALGWGLPLICKRVPIYEDAGGAPLYYSNDWELAQALDAVALSLELRDELRARSRAVSLKRGWRNSALAHLALYRA